MLIVETATRWQAAGITTGRLRILTRSGDLVKIRHGVYATKSAVAWAGDDPRRCHALRVAAVTASVGRDSVASHHSAALIQGLDLLNPLSPDVVTLTRPLTRRSSRPSSDGLIFHACALPPEHVTTYWGVSVTTAARTVVDLARLLPFMDAVVVADSALRLGSTGKAELLRVANSCAQWPGVYQARKAIAFADRRAESALESCARVTFDAAGLEPPELQVTFRGDGFVFRGDFYWARHRTIVEADGLAKYDNPSRARDQIRRDRLLRDAGYKLVHFTWRELFDTPELVATRIRSAFASPSPF
jgi:very-short-patch-repair endonuclease